MLERRSESDQSSKGILCEIHGLRYDPKQKKGCVLCRRKRQDDQSNQTTLVVMLIVVAALAITGTLVTVRDQDNSTEKKPRKVVHTRRSKPPLTVALTSDPELLPSPPRIDPERYHDQIKAVEKVLYKPRPLDQESIERLVTLSRRLGTEIRRWEKPLVAGRLAAEVLSWSALLDSEMDVGYIIPDSAAARGRWEALRARLFTPAKWFKYSDEALDKTQQLPSPVADSRTYNALEDLSRSIKLLIQEGRRESSQIGEILSELENDPEVRRTRSQWKAWSRKWSGRVDRIGSQFPERPKMSGELNLLMAYQKLESSLHNLQGVLVAANEFGVPFNYERENRFKAAASDLTEANDYLDRITELSQ